MPEQNERNELNERNARKGSRGPRGPSRPAYGLGRGSRRWAQWLLNHPRIGPLLRGWHADRSLPLRAKWLATLSMTASCLWAAVALPARIAWIPGLACLLVAA